MGTTMITTMMSITLRCRRLRVSSTFILQIPLIPTFHVARDPL
jgi:hypothetical protein